MKKIDAEGAVMGRLASNIAKKLLKGTQVKVVNVEKSVITGKEQEISDKYRKRLNRADKANPTKGPHFPKEPEGIFKRTIRGMIPYKTERGKKAMKKLEVTMGNPENVKAEKIGPEHYGKKIKLKTLSQNLGWTPRTEEKQ